MSRSVSVVIPTYNRPKMLAEAIQSVLAQTYPAFEIIVVDNGFFDETAAVVREFGGKVIFEKSSAPGPSPTRNRGIELARGRYVAFLDDDDLWHPEKLSIQMRFLEKNPDVGMASCRVVPFGADIRLKKESWMSGDLFSRLFMESFIRTSTVVIRKDVFRAVGGFDPRYVRAEDYDLWLRIADAFPIAHLKAPLIWARKSPQRLSDDKIDLRLRAIEVMIERFNPKKVTKRQFDRRMSDLLIYLGREQVKAGDVSGGRRRFMAALKLTPVRLRPVRYLIGTVLK
jgi:glycosyltransferase involved in cell wall biosynthesis